LAAAFLIGSYQAGGVKKINLRILSIDPSSINIGWALFKKNPTGHGFKVEEHGTIHPRGDDAIEHCQDIAGQFERLKALGPEYVIIERYHFKRAKTAYQTQMQAYSIGKLVLATGAIIAQFSETTLRMVNGHKTKAQAKLVAASYGVTKGSEHSRDAISMGSYWIANNLP